jgi:hypothetical protein
LISIDLLTITRNGAELCGADCGGKFVVCVPVGLGFCDWALLSACCASSAKAGVARINANNEAPSKDLQTIIFRFLSL